MQQAIAPSRSRWRIEQAGAAGQCVGEINRGALLGVGRPAMGDERESRQGQQFIEDEEGEQVAGHGNAHRRRHAQAEETEEAAAVRRIFEIADGVEGGQ